MYFLSSEKKSWVILWQRKYSVRTFAFFFFCQCLMRLIRVKISNLKVNTCRLQPLSLKKIKSNESWSPLFSWRYILTILWIFYTFLTDKTIISFCSLIWFVYEQKIIFLQLLSEHIPVSQDIFYQKLLQLDSLNLQSTIFLLQSSLVTGLHKALEWMVGKMGTGGPLLLLL